MGEVLPGPLREEKFRFSWAARKRSELNPDPSRFRNLLLRLNLFFLFLFIFPLQQWSQSKCPPFLIMGAGAEVAASGNAHGTFYSPYFSLSNGRSSYLIGAMFHKRSLTFSGCKITYSRNLTGYQPDSSVCKNVKPTLDRLQLNFFAYFQLLNSVPLSYSAVKIEEKIHDGVIMNWSEVKLNTAELAAGLEFRWNISSKLSWRSFLGASAFSHTSYRPDLYHERSAVALCLGTGINYLFR